MRRGVGGLVAGALLLAGGCGGPPPLDPTSGAVAAQRTAVVESMLGVARVAANQLGAGSPLGVRTDTRCLPGDRRGPHNDDDKARSTCNVVVTTAYAVDVAPLPALDGLDSRLALTGWQNYGGWILTAGRGGVSGLEAWNRLGYRLEDLDGLAYSGPQGEHVSLRLQPSAASVPAPEPVAQAQTGLGPYFASTDGTDWQEAWAQQQSRHRYLLVVSGSVVFANQPW